MLIAGLGLLSLLVTPMVWIAIPVSQAGRAFPMAGPPVQLTHISPVIVDPALTDYLLAHKGQAQFLFATVYAEAASPFIMNTGQPVMSLGGYNGGPSYLTPAQLIQQINQGRVHFFLVPWSSDPTVNWVLTHCPAVPTSMWQSPDPASYLVDELRLYYCARHT